MAQKVTATALRAARTRLYKADKDTLRRVLFAITVSFESCGNLGDDTELLAAICRDLRDYGMLPLEEESHGEEAQA